MQPSKNTVSTSPVTPIVPNVQMTNKELIETKSVLARLGLDVKALEEKVNSDNVELVEKAERKTHKHFCTDSKNLEKITSAEKAVADIDTWEYNPLTLNKGEVKTSLLIGDEVDSSRTIRKVVDVKLNFKTETRFYNKEGKLLTVPEKKEEQRKEEEEEK